MKPTVLRLLAALAAVAAFTGPRAAAQPPPAEAPASAPATARRDEALAALFSRIEVQRQTAIREISRLDAGVERETSAALRSLDELFAQEIPLQIEAHLTLVEDALRGVSLGDVGTWEAAWAGFKAGIGARGQLEEICRTFVSRAAERVRPLQEELLHDIDERISRRLERGLTDAQTRIRERFDEVLTARFPAWGRVSLPLPPLPETPIETAEIEAGSATGFAAGISGVAILVLRRSLQKIVARMMTRMAGKMVAKLIPFAGAALLAYDVYDASQARARLESDLRAQFLSEYRESFTALAIWRQAADESGATYRQTVERRIQALLAQWAAHCADEARRVLDAAHVLASSESVGAYLEKQAGAGRNTREIVEELSLAWDTFHELVAVAPVDTLLEMLVHAPDRGELRWLADELGETLLTRYREAGRSFLIAAHAVGMPEFLDVVRSEGVYDWRQVAAAFEHYGRALSQSARRGLLLLIREGVDHRVATADQLDAIGARSDQFVMLLRQAGLKAGDALLRIQDGAVAETIERVSAADPAAAARLAATLSVEHWRRYADPQRRAALIELLRVETARGDRSSVQVAERVARDPERVTVFQEYGESGLAVWSALVGDGGGQSQRETGRRALRLLARGYSADALRSADAVEFAALCDAIPGVGPALHGLLRPLGSFAYFTLFVLGVALIGTPLVWFARFALRRRRRPAARPVRRVTNAIVASRAVAAPPSGEARGGALPPSDRRAGDGEERDA